MYQQPQPPGYAGQPPPAPPEQGLYPQPGAVPSYNQPQAGYGAPPPQPPQQTVVYPQPPAYGVATQQTFVQQPAPVATVTTVQPMPQNTVIIQQGPRKPENYMVMAVLVTFFCNCPLGMIAWIFSCLSDNSYNEGNHDEARKQGRVSMWLSIAGIIITVILVIVIPAALIGAAADAIGNKCGNNFYGDWGCYSCEKCMHAWNWGISNWDKRNCKQLC